MVRARLALIFAAALLALSACQAKAENLFLDQLPVKVCDPADATKCIKPAADGSIPVTGAAGGGGDASAANQTAVQATAGSDASKAVAVQGITGGKPVPVSAASGSIASGAIASGAVASGAVASGAFTSGSVTDGAIVTLGNKTDAKSTATDSTSVSAMSVLKQISASAQAGTANTGSTVPTGAVYVGANSGGNLTGIIQADASVPINISTATTTQLVALSAGKKIYVTNYKVIAGGTGNFKFVYGTGTNCGTGTTDLEGANNLTAQAGSSDGGGLGAILFVPAGNALCATTSANVQMSGHVAYTQY